MWGRLFPKEYLCASVAYCCARKLPHLYDARVDDRKMLTMEKAGVMAVLMLYAPLAVPWWAYMDLEKLEIYLRGEDERKYGYLTPYSFAAHVLT